MVGVRQRGQLRIGLKGETIATESLHFQPGRAARKLHQSGIIGAVGDRVGSVPQRRQRDSSNVGGEAHREVLHLLLRMAKTRKLKRNWSICDLKILIWLICKHCEQTGVPINDVHNHDDSWQLISSLIPGTSPDSCLFKWLSLRRHKITLHGWSEQEEQILLQL